MEQKFLVSLMDGIKFWTTDVNLSTLSGVMNQNNIFAVKIGNKSFQKHTIGFIAKAEAIEEGDNNVVMKLNNELLYTMVDDTDKAITDLTDKLNKKDYVLLNDSILFNRGLFQYAEPCDNKETQSIG
ncbi:hypothetical protein MKX47_21110 [Solibacillus sp. FSL R7-0668]|uniref:hypothetical protein n=1 Tax=Solibacillus sp. FSL R7-0668 TaxID=2921688 RepID=UPI0030F4FA23